jgi:hypothetical protein
MNSCHPRPKSRDHLMKLFAVVIVALTLIATPAMSQNTFPSSGNVGVGTATPLAPLHVFTGTVNENLWVRNSSGVLNLASANTAGSAFMPLRFDASSFFFINGSVGIGTAPAAGAALDIRGGKLQVVQLDPSIDRAMDVQISHSAVGTKYGMIFAATGASTTNIGMFVEATNATNNYAAIFYSGSVGIGTLTPAAKLDVNGNGNFNGNVTVSGNIAAKYQDVAEWVQATETMEPGTVVVLNPEKSNEVMPATRAYDTTVAGVVSTNPGLTLGESAASKAQIATVGRVRVKASATGQPIHIGDLLVTSGKSGLAMKSEPMEIRGRAFHQPGTILGKALEPLASGEGEILVLLSLQ